MASVIAFASPQDGVGKSTLLLNLARAFEIKGFSVLVVDADPEARVRDWQFIRKESSAPSVIGIDSAWVLEKEMGRLSSAYDYIFVDTAPTLRATLLSTLQIANLVLIPTCVAPLDPWSMNKLAQLIQRQRAATGEPAAAFVITRCDETDVADGGSLEKLEPYGLPVLTAHTKRRSLYLEAQANGQTVIELQPESEAAMEIHDIRKEISNSFLRTPRSVVDD